jgi:RNase P subunit RPR2
MSEAQITTFSDVQAAVCAKCNAHMVFYRSTNPRIDECGFESYSFACDECGTAFAGIVDPFDQTLLLSQSPV